MKFFKILNNIFQRNSLLRSELHFLIKTINISKDARILDLGSGSVSTYHKLINKSFTVDIDVKKNPDIVMDLENDIIPKEFNNIFDYVVAFNILEHIYNYKNVISNSYNCLKVGGKIIIIVPFLNGIHGEPHDFGRYTNYHIEKSLKEFNFSNIQISPINVGFFVLWFNFIQHYLWFGGIRVLFYVITYFLDFLLMPFFNILFKEKIEKKLPICYFVIAQK